MKCLVLAYVWPELESSAAGLRTQNLLDILRVRGWQVTVASVSKANSYKDRLDQKGFSTQELELNSDSFDHFVGDLQPDLVLFDRFVTEEQFSWRVKRVCPNALRILDTQDLHFLRRARQKSLEQGVALNLQSDDTHREIASIYRCDLSLVISDFEFKLLTEKFSIPAHLLRLHRFSYDVLQDHALKARPGFEARRDFVILGNFRHPPNADAVKWLRHELWPLIHQQLPNVECHVYGAYPPKDAMAMGDSKIHFKVKGWAENQHQVFRQYRVNLAPLRFGAGIKGKISDGWYNGIPVVTTPIGAEGMHGEFPFGGLIANESFDFAKKATELYTLRDLWQGCQRNGDQVMRNLYSFTRNAADLLQSLTEIHNDVEAWRARNVTGNMLWLQSNRSVEYFSRWIQLKNESSDSKS